MTLERHRETWIEISAVELFTQDRYVIYKVDLNLNANFKIMQDHCISDDFHSYLNFKRIPQLIIFCLLFSRG